MGRAGIAGINIARKIERKKSKEGREEIVFIVKEILDHADVWHGKGLIPRRYYWRGGVQRRLRYWVGWAGR